MVPSDVVLDKSVSYLPKMQLNFPTDLTLMQKHLKSLCARWHRSQVHRPRQQRRPISAIFDEGVTGPTVQAIETIYTDVCELRRKPVHIMF